MILYFVQEAKYVLYNNKVYSPRINYITHWERYLSHFNQVVALARVENVENMPEPDHYHRVDGPNVSILPLPMYDGPIGLLKVKNRIRSIIDNEIPRDSAVVLRVPGHLGLIAQSVLQSKGMMYACELVGDPLEVSKYMPYSYLLRKSYGYYMYSSTKKLVRDAIGVLYVTDYALQQRYPLGTASITASASNVILPDQLVIDKPKEYDQSYLDRLYDNQKKPIKIGVVGMLYSIKSPREIISACSKILQSGMNVQLYFAGDGPMREELQDLCEELLLTDNVIFLGNLKGGAEVFNFLDSLDLFVQFSKTEGLPRSSVEAMARGCPILASAVGGQVELVEQKYLVQSQNVEQLFNKMKFLLNNPSAMNAASRRNIEASREYTMSVLKEKRYNYYNKVLQIFNQNNTSTNS
ncbi:glycosyltransferase [Saprospiraceae bacterium]|nr:glycosyltransferase [Saprospiraceae bacterium]